MKTLQEVITEVSKIQKRNEVVSKGKAWEVSYTRRIILMIFTYISVGFYLSVIGISNAWLHAIVPSIAFMLSTLTLPFCMRIWLSFQGRR